MDRNVRFSSFFPDRRGHFRVGEERKEAGRLSLKLNKIRRTSKRSKCRSVRHEHERHGNDFGSLDVGLWNCRRSTRRLRPRGVRKPRRFYAVSDEAAAKPDVGTAARVPRATRNPAGAFPVPCSAGFPKCLPSIGHAAVPPGGARTGRGRSLPRRKAGGHHLALRNPDRRPGTKEVAEAARPREPPPAGPFRPNFGTAQATSTIYRLP
ncbi:hypothetical protein DFJ74DRAFT_693833 [Hyaloraphidium curvatum]|nr:hypothetical protein DFJ74DRAFT_693833 [Hyaloraphidium curvatum]